MLINGVVYEQFGKRLFYRLERDEIIAIKNYVLSCADRYKNVYVGFCWEVFRQFSRRENYETYHELREIYPQMNDTHLLTALKRMLRDIWENN